MNLKKYFNWKIGVGLVATIIGIILLKYSIDGSAGVIFPTGEPHTIYPLPSWLVFSTIPLIALGLIILIWGILEKILQRMDKSTKILNIVTIIVLILLVIYLGFAIWVTHYRVQPIQPPIFPPIETTSIAKLKQSCITNNGNEFNKECEGKLIEMENLYLYPAQSDNPSDGFYLYDSYTYSTYSDSIDSDLAMKSGSHITVYAREDLELLNKIKDEVTTLERSIPVSIKGVIKSDQLCTQWSPCKFGLMIFLEDITFNGFYGTGSGIYRNEEYKFEIKDLGNFKYEEIKSNISYINEEWYISEVPGCHISISTEDNNRFRISVLDLSSVDFSSTKQTMYYSKHDFIIDGIKGSYYIWAGDNSITYIVSKGNYEYKISSATMEKIFSNFKFIE